MILEVRAGDPHAAIFAAAPSRSGALAAIAQTVTRATETMRTQAKNHFLVADMLGYEIIGSSGEMLGTGKNLVVVPGGQVVAATVKPWEAHRPACQVLMVSTAASPSTTSSALTLPMSQKEARGTAALQD